MAERDLQSDCFELPSYLKERKLNKSDFCKISNVIGEENVWKKIARRLNLDERDIININASEKDYGEKANAMLLLWLGRFPEQCKVGTFYAALKDERFNNKAGIFLQLVKNSTDPSKTSSSDLEMLKARMKYKYNTFSLPENKWKSGKDKLQDCYTKLTLRIVTPDGSYIPLEENEIFSNRVKTLYNKDLNLILVESTPGFGKSSYLKKLASDWSNPKNNQYIQHFTWVFYISLKEFEDHTIPEAISSVANYLGFGDEEALQSILNEQDSKMLILLDGYNEITSDLTRASVLNVLHKVIFFNAIVVMSCKTGTYNPSSEELKPFNRLGLHCASDIWDRRIQICGFELNDGLSLFAEMTGSEFKALPSVAEILKSPQMINVISFLKTNDKEVKNEIMTTKLVMKVCSELFIIQQKRLKSDVDKELFQIGELCFNLISKTYRAQCSQNKCIIDESLYESEHVVLILKMREFGLLHRIVKPKSYTIYEPVHQLFLDIFAAFYVCKIMIEPTILDRICYSSSALCAKSESRRKEIQNQVEKQFAHSKVKSLLLPFVATMLGQSAGKLNISKLKTIKLLVANVKELSCLRLTTIQFVPKNIKKGLLFGRKVSLMNASMLCFPFLLAYFICKHFGCK